MSNHAPSRTILSSLFAGTESDDDSAFSPDVSVWSNETGGDSLFDELSLASGDLDHVYGQGTCQDGDERDDDSRSEAADSLPHEHLIACYRDWRLSTIRQQPGAPGQPELIWGHLRSWQLFRWPHYQPTIQLEATRWPADVVPPLVG